MSKTKLKEASRRFLRLLKLSIVSFVSMGILIGYHGAPLINSLIGVFWFVFAVTAGLVVISVLSKDTGGTEHEWSAMQIKLEELEPACCEKQIDERRKKRSAHRQKVSESA